MKYFGELCNIRKRPPPSDRPAGRREVGKHGGVWPPPRQPAGARRPPLARSPPPRPPSPGIWRRRTRSPRIIWGMDKPEVVTFAREKPVVPPPPPPSPGRAGPTPPTLLRHISILRDGGESDELGAALLDRYPRPPRPNLPLYRPPAPREGHAGLVVTPVRAGARSRGRKRRFSISGTRARGSAVGRAPPPVFRPREVPGTMFGVWWNG